MRRLASFLLVAGLVVGVAPQAHAAPTSNDPKTAARDAAAWIVSQTSPEGFIPSGSDPTKPDLSSTAQAVLALAAAGVGKATVTSMLDYLGTHVDDYVVVSGVDFPGAIANLIMDAKVGGLDPSAFGSPPQDLVARLLATEQSDGQFGSADNAQFDGAFRQGLALMALSVVGDSNPDGAQWLEDQQCDDGTWMPFRATKNNKLDACTAPDPVGFTGPDTNSTALAILGLAAQDPGSPAIPKAVNALVNARLSDGGWGFIITGTPSDANSTGVVLSALQTANGAADEQGIKALLALQVGCTGDPADRGGIAFQPGAGGELVPNAFATVQAVPALAEVALPMTTATIADAVPVPCATSTTTVPVTTQGASTSTTTVTVAAATTTSGELPRTGAPIGALAFGAVVIGAIGAALAGSARRRRSR